MSDTPDGWIETPTGPIPDPRKHAPKKSVPANSASPGIPAAVPPTSKKSIPSKSPSPVANSASFSSSSNSSYAPPAYAVPRSKRAKTSVPSKKGHKFLGIILVVVLTVGFKLVDHLFQSDSDSSDSSSSSQDYELADEDYDSYDPDDQFTLGKPWSGTVGAEETIKNYKPVVSDCRSFTDEDGNDAVRCAVKWTNPYSTTIKLSDMRFPSFEFVDGTGEDVDEALVSPDSPYYDETFSDATVAAKQGDTETSYIFFSPTQDDTVWIGIRTEVINSEGGTRYRQYLETTIAKVDMKTLEVTNATWKK